MKYLLYTTVCEYYPKLEMSPKSTCFAAKLFMCCYFGSVWWLFDIYVPSSLGPILPVHRCTR